MVVNQDATGGAPGIQGLPNMLGIEPGNPGNDAENGQIGFGCAKLGQLERTGWLGAKNGAKAVNGFIAPNPKLGMPTFVAGAGTRSTAFGRMG